MILGWRVLKRYTNNDKGLTLIEILAAVVILSIVLVTFTNLFLQSAKHTKFNNEKLTAVQVAEDVVAKVRANEYKGKSVGQKFSEIGYDGYEVSIEIKDGPSGVNLHKAIIKVNSSLDTGTKKSSFVTEMYYEDSP